MDLMSEHERQRQMIQFRLQTACIQMYVAFQSVVCPDENLRLVLQIALDEYRRFMNDPTIPLSAIVGDTASHLIH